MTLFDELSASQDDLRSAEKTISVLRKKLDKAYTEIEKLKMLTAGAEYIEGCALADVENWKRRYTELEK